ncbi:MAG TPA: permease prefix domain 1-containing protein [Chthonomonadaceae bacterium]|nr:permease prefix domain 1-containing protein [Chthonomonadaceae bacterium]
MLEQHPEPASSRNQPVKSDYATTQIEAYLDRIAPSTGGTLTAEAQQERRAEMRAHLEALIAAYIELGDTPEHAVAKTLQQFGSPRAVQREWQHTLCSPESRSVRPALGIALRLNALVCLISLILIPKGIELAANLGSNAAGVLTDINLYVLPAVAGLLAGFLARSRPMLGTLYALLILLLPMMALDAWRSHDMGSGMWIISAVSQLAIFSMCWIPVACANAGLAGLLKRWITGCRRTLSAAR